MQMLMLMMTTMEQMLLLQCEQMCQDDEYSTEMARSERRSKRRASQARAKTMRMKTDLKM
jgi:hypothetical protein